MKTTPDELQASLDHFIGGGDQYRHWTGLRYTEGIHPLAETAGAFWLIDAIASYQRTPKIRRNSRLQVFQLWRLVVADSSAVLDCREDSGCRSVVRQNIEYTDFPLPEFSCYVCHGVLMLKNEY